MALRERYRGMVFASGFFFILLQQSYETEGRIEERSQTVCNGPCGQMSISCPKGQRVAIRDAVYRVQEKTNTCIPFPDCNDVNQDVCCETTTEDCVFPYSVPHLRVLHRNCSGVTDCLIQTERSAKETVQCKSTDHENIASQTVMNYICVADDLIADICSPTRSVVQGKTLFAMIDPRGSKRPKEGSVCTCQAESTQWPTTNNIAVFLVDLRLNKLDSSEQCANSSLSLRSGSNEKMLDCQTSRDPRYNFPFVAVLNDTNVATLRLQLHEYLPEFIWVGFEANEDEDIRLTCKLQGLVPVKTVTDRPANNNIEDKTKMPILRKPSDDEITLGDDESLKRKKNKNMPPIIGGAAAGFVVIIIIVVIILLIKKRKKKPRPPPSIPDDPDMEIYYSTTDEELKNMEAVAAKKNSGRNSTSSTQELYISPEDVRANKRKNTSKRVRIISTPDFLDDYGEEYVSAELVRERKRQSKKAKHGNKENMEEKNDSNENSDYDRLHQRSKTQEPDLDSYDQLGPDLNGVESYSSISGVKNENCDRLSTSGNNHTEGGNVNSAYEDSDLLTVKRHPVLEPIESGDDGRGVYFELETSVARNSSVSNFSDNEILPTVLPARSSMSIIDDSNKKMPDPSYRKSFPFLVGNEEDAVYNDARSEAADKEKKDLTKLSGPVAAPRRKMNKPVPVSPDYDIAKPIE